MARSQMTHAYLEVTFRRGKALAAYYYLPRGASQKAAKSVKFESGLIADLDKAGQPIGIEITAPSKVTRGVFNRVLTQFGFPALSATELKPLKAA